MSGRTISAARVSRHEIDSIMPSTPSSVRTALSAPDSDCWSVLVTLSMSLVTRLSISPR